MNWDVCLMPEGEIEPYVLGVYLKAVGRTLGRCQGVCQTVMFGGRERERKNH